MYVYKDKAEMNLECQELLSLIRPQKALKAVSFTTDMSAWSEASDPNADIKATIKEFIKEQKEAILTKVTDSQAMVLETLQRNQGVILELQGLMRNQEKEKSTGGAVTS